MSATPKSPRDLAAAIYRHLRSTAMKSAPSERLTEEFDCWGEGLDAAIAASNGHLRRSRFGMVEAVENPS